MIGKVTIGKSFRGCIKYCLEDKIATNQVEFKDRAEVLMYNKCFGNTGELVQQFNDVRGLNRKLSKPVLHITLSLAPGENLSKDKLMEVCEQCAKEIGFANNQFIAVSHQDTSHQHLHIVANRIGFDKRTVSDSNNYQKIAAFCRKMELKYDLKPVLSPKKFLPREQRNLPRLDQRKEQLRQNIKEALVGCLYLAQFEQNMKARGYEIIKGRGISFADEKKVTFKGSEVNYSLQTIEQILERKRYFGIKPAVSLANQKEVVADKTGSEKQTLFASQNNTLQQQLIKPENEGDTGNSLFKKQKRKKRSQHL